MVKIKVLVEDMDTDEFTELTLPCDVRNKLDTSHSLYIADWERAIGIGYCDDVVQLNDALDEINAECPSMTIEILEAIILTVNGDLDNEYFVQKICSNNFLFEEITGVSGTTDEEKCARYLATEMMIPFARNITDIKLETICANANKVKWEKVWKHYETMGFEIITIDTKLYAFHWGNAAKE